MAGEGEHLPQDIVRRKILRDPQAQQDFSRNGFVAMPMLSEAEVAALSTAASALRPNDAFDPRRPNWRAASYHCSFLDTNRDYRRRAFELISRTFTAHVEQVLQDYRIIQCNFYVKPAGRGKFNLHQNWPLTANLDETSVSIWCPLVDATGHNGGLCAVPASHKIVPHVQGPNTDPYFQGLEERMWAAGMVETFSVPAGSAVIFDDGLIHGSPTNQGETPRFAVQLMCVPAESTPAYYRDIGGGRFEVVRADVDFWLENDIKDLLDGNADWEMLGVVEGRNRQVDFDELTDLLTRSDDIRRTSIALHPVVDDVSEPPRFLPRWLGRKRSA
ncbi:phytanoyl-CoA dioxygenase family protein [Allosphingosinicella deserti]|nr:phytanoyl-CoA dioxygenase family protein [Sphingomonas deserti]